MGFSFRVGKGVRIRVSSRGVRASVGPRAARLHVGGGRPGISTGVGPLTCYAPLGGGSRRGGGRSAGATQRQLAQARKAEQAQQIAAALQHILDLHRQTFPPAQPPVAPPPEPVDERAIRTRHESTALRGISIFRRARRREAERRAAVAAEAEIRAERERRERERARAQEQLDAAWRRLLANDPPTVLAALDAAFEDNEARATALDVDGDEVELVVLPPTPDVLPERLPATTPAGNLTLKRTTKTEAAQLYKTLVAGHVLATVREAFAVAPSLRSARVVAIRVPEIDADGRPRTEVLLAARFERAALDGIQWDRAEAPQVVVDAASELVVDVKGRAKELHPVDLSREPDLAELVQRIDVEELTSATPGRT
jgi:hypothetical protein